MLFIVNVEYVYKDLSNLLINIAIWRTMTFENYFNINGKNNDGLTLHQFNILSAIFYAGINTISSLENILGISKSSLSITIKKMEKEGYITKKSGIDSDGRKVYIEITEKGINEMNEKNKMMYKLFKNFFNSLSEDDKNNLSEGIESFSKIFNSDLKIMPKTCRLEDL